MVKSNNLAVLILAAGTSSRLGETKQLVKIKDETLIQNAIKNALKLSANVNVVLGHKSNEIKDEINDLPIKILVNPNFKEGMGFSLSYGISKLNKFDKVLIMLCDQPFIPIIHYENLLQKSNKNEDTIVCSKYQGKLAVPSIFPKKYYKDLEKLGGDKGARKLLEENSLEFINLDDKYSIDIDTKEDLSKLNLF